MLTIVIILIIVAITSITFASSTAIVPTAASWTTTSHVAIGKRRSIPRCGSKPTGIVKTGIPAWITGWWLVVVVIQAIPCPIVLVIWVAWAKGASSVLIAAECGLTSSCIPRSWWRVPLSRLSCVPRAWGDRLPRCWGILIPAAALGFWVELLITEV